MACCKDIVLKSTKYTEEQLKSLGKYILKPTDVVENHAVYKHELNDEHIAFSADYGWTVYPNTPDDKDPPLVSFNECKPPAYSDCPTKCVNSGQWTYFYQNTVADKNKTLSLKCFEEADPSEGGVSAEAVVGIIMALLFAVVLLILSIYRHNPDWLPKWLQNQLSQLKLRFLGSSNGEQSHPDGPQSHSLMENGDNPQIPVNTVTEQRKNTIKVVVSTKMLQLPIDKCVLKVSGDPTANEQNRYKYFFDLKKDHNDISLEELSPECLDNILQLPQFKSLTHGEYHYKVKVTSSDQTWEGEDSGQLTIHPESSMTDSISKKYEKRTNIQVGDPIWKNDTPGNEEKLKISKLPKVLEETSLFVLPLKGVETKTVFTITALPSSTIYIVNQKDGGWLDSTLKGHGWTKENFSEDPFEIKKTPLFQLPTGFSIFSLWTGSNGTTVLPDVANRGYFTIFLKEGLPEGIYHSGGAITMSQNTTSTNAGN